VDATLCLRRAFLTHLGISRISATGHFQSYQLETDISIYKADIKKFSEEGEAFGAEQQLMFKNEIEFLAEVDAEIKKCEREINVKFSKLNTTQAYKKQQEVERSKLNTMKARRLLMKQDHDLRKEIEDIDITMTTKHSQMFQLLFRIKENMVNGVSFDPEVQYEFMQLMPRHLPLNHAKEPLRAELQRLRKERAELELKMEGVV
jgi:hypothetical protein